MESDPPMPPQLVENPWVDEQTLGQPPYAPVVPSMLSKAVPGYTQQEEEAEREDDEGEWHGDHLLPIPVPDEDTEDEWLPYRADDRYSDEEASFLPSKSVYKTPKSTRKQPYYIEDSENYLMDGMDVDTGAESDDDTEAEVDALGADSATPPARDVTLTGSGRPGKRKRTIDPNENEFDASRPELSIEPARTQEMMPGPSTSTNGAFDTLEFTATKMRKKAIEILRLKIQQATLDGNPYTREEITQMYEEIQERYPIKVSFPELRLEPRKPLSSTKRIARRQRDPGSPIAAAIAEERAAVEKAALEKAQQTAREQAAQAAEKAAHGPPPIPTPPSSGHARKLIAQNALATYNSPAALILQRVRAEATTIPNTESPSLSRIADSSSKRQEDKARIDSEPPARHMFNDRHDVDEDNNEDNTSIFLSRSGATIESTFDQMTRKLPRTARDHFHHKVQRIADANRVGTPDDTDSQAEKPAPPSMADARAKIAAAMAEISQYTKPATPRPVPARPGATPAVQTPKLFTNPERAQPESAPLPRPDPPESAKPHLDSQPLRPSATKLASQDSATATATADVTIIATRENVTNSVPPSQPPTRTILPQIHRTRSQSKALRSSSPVPWISQPSSRSSSSARKRYHPTNQAVGIPLGEHPELAAHYVRKEPPPQQRRIVEVGDEEDELA
ncbi:hypothetical protein H2203_004501 [Taxawa tesnikishii (nom. ined.)]|nr:hypothetical protein H2203_004501 [Dothideales sp. JES 119]